ncbi:ABC transporter ATP-binding protein [Nocardiopsis sp. MG754419]|uniref:ABC transporter ATP-binding protein n=1 Tax=Nocardiopsis sp. MG754419 TaxID=2259865 RepID=UPI001BA485F6|nr:ATP-binding cassette domain-containing protein [Nocardiopsis sp. MG754419]MBR8740402.1 ABC transporter ATP-binding protein [Nocardiopsis sp. MG754419]
MIEVRGLTKVYRGNRAVDDLTFTAPAGRVTGFLGPNGAGKTTTMRMVLGLERPTAGTALVDGAPYAASSAPMRSVGALLDTAGIPAGITAAAHLGWLARAGNLPGRRVGEVLETVGLADVARRRVGDFSLGMRQRLGLAAALLGDPGTLVLDEPVNGLDPEGVRWIRTFLRRLAAEGRTVLLSSHLMSETAETADRVVVIGAGRLVADTTVDELTGGGAHGRVRVGCPRPEALAAALTDHGWSVEPAASGGTGELIVTGTDPAAVGEVAARYGIALHALTSERTSLEDVFMRLTGDSAGHRFAPAGAVTEGER